MVFVCVGLGGGTGSGAAPLVTRIAREMGAFVVVFATMPFSFEGKRRREQSETALNELSVLANALVTFDNGRMGELVLAQKGIHEAFTAADKMISDSIRAVTRLVIRPGLINVGLDDLMSSLKATRSRCLFGSGIAKGENRSKTALKAALNSPLLDKGRLLKNTQTALVHVCGGSEMTLYEVELLMRDLAKTVPESAHILFGAAVDDTMGDSLSVTIISSLPEEHVIVNEDLEEAEEEKSPDVTPTLAATSTPDATPTSDVTPTPEVTSTPDVKSTPTPVATFVSTVSDEPVESEDDSKGKLEEKEKLEEPKINLVSKDPGQDDEPEKEDQSDDSKDEEKNEEKEISEQEYDDPAEEENEEEVKTSPPQRKSSNNVQPQGELLLDGGPRGKFEGEAPNLVDGEDLDVPAFLRKKK